jgi:nucleoid-associated protein YgaU
MSKSVNYGELKSSGSGSSSQQFVNRNAETLSMELFFDTSEARTDVREEHVARIDGLLEVDPELHAPPLVEFNWGSLAFTALVESVDKSFTRFLPDGKPVRARVNVTFKEFDASDYKKRIKPESTDKTKAWTVTEGDTLWLVAADEYGDASHWRTIAEANDIENPRQLRTGTVLELPPL